MAYEKKPILNFFLASFISYWLMPNGMSKTQKPSDQVYQASRWAPETPNCDVRELVRDHVPLVLHADDWLRCREVPVRKGATFLDLRGVVKNHDSAHSNIPTVYTSNWCLAYMLMNCKPGSTQSLPVAAIAQYLLLTTSDWCLGSMC